MTSLAVTLFSRTLIAAPPGKVPRSPIERTSSGPASPADAAGRSPSLRPAAPTATPGTPSADAAGVPAPRASPAAPPPDRLVPLPAPARPATGGRPASGTGAHRRAIARSGSSPRAPPDDGGDTVPPGSTRSSGRPAPSGARDAPRRLGRCSPGSGSPGPDAAAPAAARAESSASGPRSPPPARPRRAASRPGLRRTPTARTFPRKRGSPLPARIGRVAPDPRGPRRPRGPPPDTGPLGPQDLHLDIATLWTPPGRANEGSAIIVCLPQHIRATRPGYAALSRHVLGRSGAR